MSSYKDWNELSVEEKLDRLVVSICAIHKSVDEIRRKSGIDHIPGYETLHITFDECRQFGVGCPEHD